MTAKKATRAAKVFVVAVNYGDGSPHHMETFSTLAAAKRYAPKGAAMVQQPVASADVYQVPADSRGPVSAREGAKLVHHHSHRET